MRRTRTLERFPDQRPAASGVWVCETRTLYRFEDLGPRITIGASPRCDIRLESRFVSAFHAVMWRRDGVMWLEDTSSHHTTFVDGWPITGQPTAILLGMEIHITRILLMATNEAGEFPISAVTPSELSAKARERYGSYRLAAEHLNRSHSTIQRHTKRHKERMIARTRKNHGDPT